MYPEAIKVNNRQVDAIKCSFCEEIIGYGNIEQTGDIFCIGCGKMSWEGKQPYIKSNEDDKNDGKK